MDLYEASLPPAPLSPRARVRATCAHPRVPFDVLYPNPKGGVKIRPGRGKTPRLTKIDPCQRPLPLLSKTPAFCKNPGCKSLHLAVWGPLVPRGCNRSDSVVFLAPFTFTGSFKGPGGFATPPVFLQRPRGLKMTLWRCTWPGYPMGATGSFVGGLLWPFHLHRAF